MRLKIVNKDQAKKLKALGYEIPTYAEQDVLPYVAEAIKWLREAKDVDINILRYNPVMTEDKAYSVTIIHNADHIKLPELYRGEKSYEAAESAGLDAALEYLSK